MIEERDFELLAQLGHQICVLEEEGYEVAPFAQLDARDKANCFAIYLLSRKIARMIAEAPQHAEVLKALALEKLHRLSYIEWISTTPGRAACDNFETGCPVCGIALERWLASASN